MARCLHICTRTPQRNHSRFLEQMAGICDSFSIVPRFIFSAVTICAVLALAACSTEPAKQAYRDSSDWLNDIPDPPADGDWRLSKRIGPDNEPYPNLGDVPDRPVPDEAQVRMDKEILEIERTGQGRALSTPAERRVRAVDLGAPPPASVEPLSIPPEQ